MKKRLVMLAAVTAVAAVAVITVFAYNREKPVTMEQLAEGEFWYTPDTNPIEYTNAMVDVSGSPTETFAQLENGSKSPGGATVICSVAGPSINRIIYPPRGERDPYKVYGSNHVVTPITIQNVLFVGDEIALEEGETINILEPYYYVTEETPDELEYLEFGTVISTEYEPMEQGKVYLVFLHNSASERYYYKEEPVLSIAGYREGVYCLSDSETHQGGIKTPYYDAVWQDAKKKYGSLANR